MSLPDPSALPQRLLLADALLYLHLAYVATVVLVPVLVLIGGWRGWDWVRSWRLRGLHLLMMVVPASESVVGYECPLTTWEYELRRAAGQTAEELSLTARLARDLLFVEATPRTLMWCYLGFLGLIVLCFWLVPPRRRQVPAMQSGVA
jgi:Protein of Unknown function (DUF2784)